MNGATRFFAVGAILCLSLNTGRAETAGNSGRSLAPGTFDKTDTTNEPRNRVAPAPYGPPSSVDMGNRPISRTTRSDFGLSAATRRKLDEALRDPSKIRSVLDQLPERERAAATDYLNEKGKPAPTTGPGPLPRKPVADKADCAGMRELFNEHSRRVGGAPPKEDWIVDQMARSHCKPDGTPMSLREATKYDMEMNDRRKATSAADGIFDCSYKPAGGGAAWDATCAPRGRWPAGATCNAGEICPDEAKLHQRPSLPGGDAPAPADSGPGRDWTTLSRPPSTGGSTSRPPARMTAPPAAPTNPGSGVAHGRNPVAPPVARQRNNNSDITGIGGARGPGGTTGAGNPNSQSGSAVGGVRIDVAPVGTEKDLSSFTKEGLSLKRSAN